jgi:hypothetical protein
MGLAEIAISYEASAVIIELLSSHTLELRGIDESMYARYGGDPKQ